MSGECPLVVGSMGRDDVEDLVETRQEQQFYGGKGKRTEERRKQRGSEECGTVEGSRRDREKWRNTKGNREGALRGRCIYEGGSVGSYWFCTVTEV
ncbi:hypothetical protein VNO77_20691 [Canavalia gladiata]|uniref:Uncharacterized protein n=1 Tax=Canavalia gladiata TaxID=3824 RepID=A0AAN9LPQ1_CANGL